MARPPLVLGTWGKIKRAQRGGSWIAYARFRDYDGVTRQVERGGHTGAAAERALLAALRDRARLPNEDLTPETRLNRVIDDWDKHLDDRDLSDGSRVTYRRQLRHVRKAMGSLQLREVTVQAVDRFLTALQASSGPETARITRVVLSGVCQRAVRKGAMATNPVRDADTIPRKKPVVETLDVEAVGIVRSQLRAWDAGRDARGRARVTDLADPVDMIVGTGIRTGELFAVRWEDLELDLDVPLVHVTGTAVHKPKVGLVRQPYPKTEESNRSLRLPQFVVEMLLRRRVESTSEYVFDSTAGTLRSPNNFRTQWRTFRAASGYEDWVVPKTFRKAVATLVATVAGDDVAGDQLGHVKGSTVTRKNYIKRLHLGPDVREILEQFATDPALTQRIEK
ncbi:tyrosine-type recombinase/integrase [Microbacterium sp. Se63.02b]|uniref:site-specific integrase n=1 Tax=Microbacterium sp. Se63.02b TaxID=2709304 RepID=UPI001604A7F3|nr:tyrosine-type recombinase/integrase [Microbacterium sp. Se63.02b]QNA93219.1 tyrosine-type recombinase/integrase [Microbacterium sp. Se63.02b]